MKAKVKVLPENHSVALKEVIVMKFMKKLCLCKRIVYNNFYKKLNDFSFKFSTL
jgi:hypothetical protein